MYLYISDKRKDDFVNNRQMILPGVYLTCVQSHKFKTGCMSLSMLRPLTNQEAGPNALIPTVLLRGCEGNPTMASISAFMDDHYGATIGTLVRKKGEVQAVGFFLDFLEDQYTLDGKSILTPMVDFLGRVLLQPVLENGVFVEKFVAGEKQNLLNAIDSRINDKRGYTNSQLLKTMCKDEAYGVPRLGERSDVEAITADALYKQYQNMLKTSQFEIFYVGSAEPAHVAKLLRDALADLPRGELVATETKIVERATTVVEHRESMDITQGKLAMGLRTGVTASDPEYPALVLLNAIFGSGVSSKLFENVREKLSLCYYANSSLEKFKGVMLISSGVAFENFEIAKTSILKELDDCVKGEISDYEMESARTHLLSGLRTGMDSPGRLDDYALGQVILGQDGTMADLADGIRVVTKEQVAQVAGKITLDTIYYLEGNDNETV